MIKEISNFVESIKPEYFTSGLNPSPGLHIKINIDENGEVLEDSYKSFTFNKKGECFEIGDNNNEVIVECNETFAKREYYSGFLTINKAVDFSRKLHSSSPYILWFKKEVINLVGGRLDNYYKKVREYIDESEIKLFENIASFSKTELVSHIKNDNKIKLIKESEYVKIYYEVPFELITNAYNNYLKERIYVKDNYNITNTNDRLVYGLSGFLNGANIKKRYMMHQTSGFNVNNRIAQKEAINLFKFEKLLKSKPRKLPNPFPLFIEKEELNNEVVRLYGREGVNSFQKIIKQLYEYHQNDLTNYYLVNWSNTKKGIVLNDLDFVSSFEYKLEGMIVQNLMKINAVSDVKINNIFQFELEVVRKIFQNTLVVKTKKGDILLKYFDEIDSNYCSKATYQNILKYRNNFYDFIYKSKREAITQNIFYKILMSEIFDEIKRNDDFTKTYGIKEKLNILFSINNYFDKTNKNLGGLNMSSIIPEYLTLLREIIREDGKHLTDDDNFFAFAAGQLIYYILYQSQSANKTHALLEPYISKNDPHQFKMVITRGIEQFKHSLTFGNKKFEKLASEVLGYNCKKEIKTLLPVLLAGYFSNCLLFEKNKTN